MRPLGSFALKGKTIPVAAWEVIRRGNPAPA